MDAKQIQVGFTYTKNLGNYENLKVNADVTLSVDPDTDLDQEYEKAFKSMKKQVKKGLQEAQGGF